MKNSTRTFLADGGILLAAALWGVGFGVLKDVLDYLPPFTLLVLRFLPGGVLLGLFFLRRFRETGWGDLRDGALVGLLLFGGFACQTTGLQWTTAGKQAFLTATYVLLVPFFSWGIHRAFPGGRVFAASGICLAGMSLLTLRGASGINLGDGLTLVSAVFFAGHLMAVERFTRRRDPLVLASLQMVVLGLCALPFALFERPDLGGIPLRGWIGFGYMLLFCTIGAFALQNLAQKYTPSTHAALLFSTEALFGAASGVLLLGETFTPPMATGAALMMGAILLVELPIPFLRKGPSPETRS
ncbi:DMT family transporter [Aminomonas paucivorans]|uniref:DMT family transporter n=1 Tax=Aminomonas paucivorans TaxID=81412 RepID=UPI0033235334